jgi:hypothetical protein
MFKKLNLKPVCSVHLFLILIAFPALVFGNPNGRKYDGLDKVIQAEIKNDAFYDIIYKIAKNEPVKTILEIGSSNGQGSTDAFVKGIKENPNKPKLFCMEVSKVRFDALKQTYSNEPQVKCYNVSSVPLTDFPSEQDIITFYNKTPSKLNLTPLPMVLDWLRQDIEYVKIEKVPQNGIEIVKADNNIKNFDVVLIDGSEFLGIPELKQVYGATYILLDDVMTYKNLINRLQLMNDSNYKLVEENMSVRNGYSIFKKVKS